MGNTPPRPGAQALRPRRSAWLSGEDPMKRIAAFLLLAGLGTGCATVDGGKTTSGAKPFNMASKAKEIPGVVGPTGEPVMTAAKKNTSGVVQASATTLDTSVTQAS